MASYIVELHTGCWIAQTVGDPGRTLVKENARVYSRWQDAKCGLTWAQKYRPFENAKIVTAPKKQDCAKSDHEYGYIWRWKNCSWAPEGYPMAPYVGKKCKILCKGKRNSALLESDDSSKVVSSWRGNNALIEFKDGFKVVASWRALKRLK